MLPHHPPEVGEGRGDGSLSGDVGIGTVVALYSVKRREGTEGERLMTSELILHTSFLFYVSAVNKLGY